MSRGVIDFAQTINPDTVVGRLSANPGPTEEIPFSVLATIVLARLQATSTTTLTIGVGSVTLNVGTGKSFTPGMFVVLVCATNPAEYMAGTVTSYDPVTGQLVLNSTSSAGSGTCSSWVVSASGAAGIPGPPGPASTTPLCGLLTSSSNVLLKFSPKNGNVVLVNGVLYVVPSGGISIPNTNVEVGGVAGQTLAVSTAYDIFLKDNGSGTLIPSFYATATGVHMVSTSSGVEVRSAGGTPDDTRSYIGKCKTDTGGLFVDSAQNRLVISWFNQRPLTTIFSGTGNSANSSMTELSSSHRVHFLTFGTNAIRFDIHGYMTATAACSGAAEAVYNGVTPGQQIANYISATGQEHPIAACVLTTLAEGDNYVSAFVDVSAGQTLSVFYDLVGEVWG